MNIKELTAKLVATVGAMGEKGLLNDFDSTSVPFSLHYHSGNDMWGQGWYASVPWNDDKESDIFDTIQEAMEWVDMELIFILKDAGK